MDQTGGTGSRVLEIRDLVKEYPTPGGGVETILDVPALDVAAGEQVALAGSSGSGKTTLLHIIAGILRPDRGRVRIGDTDVGALSESARDRFRARNIGYVYQTFNLLPGYSALENVGLGMMFGAGFDRRAAQELLVALGLEDRLHYRPGQLSIGQQQRVALARALANRPRLVLADEPTGNLDPRRSKEALALIQSICRERDAALLVVTHDLPAVADFDRVLDLAEVNQVGGAA